MKEFFELLKKGRFKAIFLEPTHNGFLEFFRYLFVGGVATVVDWALLWIFEAVISRASDSATLQDVAKYIAVVIGFGGGLLVNFLLSRAMVFKGHESRAHSTAGEFTGHLLVGVIGLGLTELLVWLGDIAGIYFMISKIVATVLVFFWNYLARKFFVYKG